MSESNRQRKFSRLIQKELSELFAREVSIPGGPMVTVSLVRCTPDLGICKVFVSIFPDTRQADSVQWLTDNQREIRQKLAARIRHQVKAIPELQFYVDDSLTYSENIGKLIEDALKKDSEARGDA